ncbi:MAG: hypothetical protein LBJ57_06355 [Prevotellaceae bacterium]|jgi:DNA-binding XRE family transcriptional regulator|nr:hypothetical protein [Prevotellaceae bacterium]
MEADKVAAAVAAELDVPVEYIFSGGRKRSARYARAMFLHVCLALSPGMTHEELAALLGVHRTSASRAIRKIDAYCTIYSVDRQLANRLRSALEGA